LGKHREIIADEVTTIRRTGNVFVMTVPAPLMSIKDLQKMVGKKGKLEWVRENNGNHLQFTVPKNQAGLYVDVTLEKSRFLKVKRVDTK